MKRSLSRRDMLKLMGYGAGGIMLVSCSPAKQSSAEPAVPAQAVTEIPPAATSDVVIVTTGWPLGIMPDADTQAADPAAKVYAEVLQSWLDKHPGVTLESSNVNIWGAQDITTAIAGGTAPMYFSGGALGNWSYAGQLAAFAQGLAADMTDIVAKYEVEKKTISPAVTRWKMFSILGRHYGIPQEYNVGNGIFYRIDLLKQAGFEPPKAGWKWDDYRAMAKAMNQGNVRGAVAQTWGHVFPIQAFAGGDDGTPYMELPAPDNTWHYQYKHDAQPVVDACKFYRAMVMEDQSILTDATFTDAEVNAVFNRGEAGFMFNNPGFYVLPGDQGITPLETVLGKDRSEVVGWVSHPVGNNGGPSGTQSFVHIMTFDPNASPEALELGYDLYDYMNYGEGFKMQAQGIYAATKDLRQIFTAYPMVNGVTEIEGIGKITDAWPKHYLDAVDAAAALTQFPGKGMYLPPEANAAPPDAAYQDALSKIAFDIEANDVEALLKEATELRNQQLSGYSSSISRADFVAGMSKYYKDYGDSIQKDKPDYYANVWKPYYDANIAPQLA